MLVRTASVMSSERSSMRAHNGCVTGVDRGSPKSGTRAAAPTTAARTSVFSLPHMDPSTRLESKTRASVPVIVDYSGRPRRLIFGRAGPAASTGRPGCGQ